MTGSLIAECVLRIASALALLGFSGCASEAPPPAGQPSFYRNLAEGGQLEDPASFVKRLNELMLAMAPSA